jgi:hypothetical protein
MRVKDINLKLYLKNEFPCLMSEFKGFLQKPPIAYNLAANFFIKLKIITMNLEMCLKTIIFVLAEEFNFFNLSDFKLNYKGIESFKFHSEKLYNHIKTFKNKEFIRKEKKNDLLGQKSIEFNIYSMEKKILVLKKLSNFYKKYIGLILKNPKNISVWDKVKTHSRIKKKNFSIFLLMVKKNLFVIKKTIIDKNKINYRKRKLEKRHLLLFFFNILV